MEAICPIDSRCANEISALLSPPSPLQVQEYYDSFYLQGSAVASQSNKMESSERVLIRVYAAMDFKEGELVLKDQMFVRAQHSSNKIDCFVYSSCFRFVGSIEHQIGRRLYLQELGASESHDCDMENFSDTSKYCYEMDSSDGEDKLYLKKEENIEECTSDGSEPKIHLPEGLVESLMNGQLMLPYSKEFSLPPALPCPGGCGEAYYCSTSCAEVDWESSHSLLCTGERSVRARREALLKFIKHANETNYIFLLAAKDRDGQTTIIALRSIRTGEEIAISYVDEDLLFEERHAP